MTGNGHIFETRTYHRSVSCYNMTRNGHIFETLTYHRSLSCHNMTISCHYTPIVGE